MREVQGSKPRYSSFPFAPFSLLLLPLSSLLDREAALRGERARQNSYTPLPVYSRKSRKRAAQKLLPESWCGARLFTRRTPSLAHLTRRRPPRPPPLTPRPPLLLGRRSTTTSSAGSSATRASASRACCCDYADDTYTESHISTIGVDFVRRRRRAARPAPPPLPFAADPLIPRCHGAPLRPSPRAHLLFSPPRRKSARSSSTARRSSCRSGTRRGRSASARSRAATTAARTGSSWCTTSPRWSRSTT